MTDQIKAMLDEATRTGEPQSMIDCDEIVAKGRKRTRTKWLHVSATATVTAAVVAVTAALLVPTGGQRDHDDQAAGIDQPGFRLPDIDAKPGDRFEWMPDDDDDGEQTEETRKFDDAFWEHVENEFDDVGIVPDGDSESIEPLTDANKPAIVRKDMWVNHLNGGRVPESVDHGPIPWYRLVAELSLGRTDVTDYVYVYVHPKGSFDAGPGEEYGYRNLYTCEHRDADPQNYQPADAQRDCSEKAGPNGERIARVATEYEVDGEYAGQELSVIVYRTDGTAVTVRDGGGFQYTAHGGVDTVPDLALDLDQLTELALALPDDVLVK